MKTIIYITPIDFPSNSAAFRRVLGNCKAIKAAGFKVVVITEHRAKSITPFEYQGISVYPLKKDNSNSFLLWQKYKDYFLLGKETIKWLNTTEYQIAGIIMYSGYTPFLLKLLPWSKDKKIPLIFDAVEWYEASSSLKQWLNPYYWNIEYSMRNLLIRTKNLILISSYLHQYYAERNCNVILIPPLLDTNEIEPRLINNDNSRFVISYTGTPSHKDLFNNYLEAVLQLDPLGKKLVFHIAGVSPAQLLKYPAIKNRNLKQIPPCFLAEGFVSHDRAVEITKQADFSLLQRLNRRNANAGFPTKVVESLAVGTPVVVNLTSDLGTYIEHGKEGIVCENASLNALIKAFKEAFLLSKKELLLMRLNARKRAELSFDYRGYIQEIKQFLEVLH